MEFSKTQVKRSIRDLKVLVENLIRANNQLYSNRVTKLLNFIEENDVMRWVVKPFMEIDIDMDEHIVQKGPGFPELHMPTSEDKEIAFVLLFLKDVAENQQDFSAVSTTLFRKRHIDEALDELNSQMIEPTFDKLFNRLDDLMEDVIEKEDAEKISAQNLTIINTGNIKAENSNVAIGQDINQYQEINIRDNIMKEFLEKGVPFDQIQSISDKIDSLISEAEREEPREEKVKEFFQPIYDVAKDVAVKVISNNLPTLSGILSSAF